MTKYFKKIADPQNDVKHLNQNFDDIALEIANRSGAISSVATTNFTLTTGTTQAVEVSVNEVYNMSVFETGKMPVIPRLDLFIDNDNDFTRAYPLGGSLAAADVHGTIVDMYQSRTIINAGSQEKATVVISIHNTSASTHTYYLHIDVFYVPTPQQGVATRAS